jgi:glycosyltransferase involved in cell wall biosynthesis
MRSTKVFLWQEIIPNYRVPVFRRIAKLPGVALSVFYSRPTREHVAENLKNAKDLGGFNAICLGLLEIGKACYRFGFLRHLISGRPDVVIFGVPPRLDVLLSMALAKLMGARVLWFLGGVPYKDPGRIRALTELGRLNRWLGRYNPRRWLMFRADGMVVYSTHAKGYYSSLGFPADKIWVAPNSPDTDALLDQEAAIRQEPGILDKMRATYAPTGQKVVFMLGRLNKGRNTDVLLDAFKQVVKTRPDTALVLVGDGGERAHLEQRVKSEGIRNVHFAGAIYDDAVLARYFLLSDVFVTPGVASLALKIAMTFGVPVITADHGLELHSIEEGTNGFVVPMGDAETLAKRINTMLDDDDLRTRMSEAARNTMRNKINIGRMIEGFRRAIFAEPQPE